MLSQDFVVMRLDTTVILCLFYRPELERCYHFTQLAVQLNEPEDGVAPSDSRNRPDQRLMEEGNWDEANRLKVALEEKQRAASRKMEQDKIQAASRGELGDFGLGS